MHATNDLHSFFFLHIIVPEMPTRLIEEKEKEEQISKGKTRRNTIDGNSYPNSKHFTKIASTA